MEGVQKGFQVAAVRFHNQSDSSFGCSLMQCFPNSLGPWTLGVLSGAGFGGLEFSALDVPEVAPESAEKPSEGSCEDSASVSLCKAKQVCSQWTFTPTVPRSLLYVCLPCLGRRSHSSQAAPAVTQVAEERPPAGGHGPQGRPWSFTSDFSHPNPHPQHLVNWCI